MADAELLMFLEDVGHEGFLAGIVQRIAVEEEVSPRIEVRNASGGKGRALAELGRFLDDLRRGFGPAGDILLVAIDGNRVGWRDRKREIVDLVQAKEFPGRLACAVPEPHVERWYTLDPVALGKALQHPVDVRIPTKKGHQPDYKRLLAQIFRQAGISSTLPGAYATDIVREMDLYRAARADDSFGNFLTELRGALRQIGQT